MTPRNLRDYVRNLSPKRVKNAKKECFFMVFLKKDFEKFKVEFEKACTDNKALREKAEKEKGMG